MPVWCVHLFNSFDAVLVRLDDEQDTGVLIDRLYGTGSTSIASTSRLGNVLGTALQVFVWAIEVLWVFFQKSKHVEQQYILTIDVSFLPPVLSLNASNGTVACYSGLHLEVSTNSTWYFQTLSNVDTDMRKSVCVCVGGGGACVRGYMYACAL